MKIALSKHRLRFTGPAGSLCVRRTTRSPAAWPCSSRVNASNSALPMPLKNTGSPANAITRSWPTSMSRRRGPAPGDPRSQDRLPADRSGRAFGDSLPLPGSGVFPRGHRAKNPPAEPADQHPQRRTDHCRFRPAKKNSTRLTRPTRLNSFRFSAPAKSNAACPPTPRAWNDRSANCWPTKSRAIKSASGCSCPSTCAWAPGTCSAPGRLSPRNGSNRAWPCTWSMKRPCVCVLIASGARSPKRALS